MRRRFVAWFGASCVVNAMLVSVASAAGPFGTIQVGGWTGGAYTNDTTGAFSHCAAGMTYANGVNLIVGQSSGDSWILGFASPAFKFDKKAAFPIDVTFDGQSQARLFATAASDVMVTAILPPNVARDFRRSSLMVAVAGANGRPLQFNLTSTGPLMPVLANCVAKVRSLGVEHVGDFSIKSAAAAPTDTPAPAKPARTGSYSGTGFVISANNHIVTNYHVVKGCTGDILGNLSGDAPVKLRLVSGDEGNDLALLQASEASFKAVATIRDKTVRPGDAVVAIGYPFHGLLTSDFTVTTGIVSSLAGFLNNTRYLQISAAVQPGNSGGPLLDNAGLVVGVVSSKLNALTFARATGNIPENINFAIKTGALRDFLDNSAVPYQTADTRSELKTAEITRDARAYTLYLSCTGGEQADTAKKQATAKK